MPPFRSSDLPDDGPKDLVVASKSSLLPSVLPKDEPQKSPIRVLTDVPDSFAGSEARQLGVHPDADRDSIRLPASETPKDKNYNIDEAAGCATKMRDFFAVIEDIATGEHYHPYVHYVFSDDDPDLITNAVLDTLEPSKQLEEDEECGNGASKERYIILDMASDGQTVTSATSLSREWQILNTTTTAAPTFNDTAKIEDTGMMLHIQGLESFSSAGNLSPQDLFQNARIAGRGDVFSTMNSLAEKFQQELVTLRKLMPKAPLHSEAG